LGGWDGTNVILLRTESAGVANLRTTIWQGGQGPASVFNNTLVDVVPASGPLLGATGFAYALNGATWDRLRHANVFKVVALAAGTAETTIWTPTAGKKFRLMGFILTCGTAGSTLTFKDNTAGTTIMAARGGTDVPVYMSPPSSNGLLSAAANNPLTVTRGTSCTLDGVVYGTEE
jgi:hypothetical protein